MAFHMMGVTGWAVVSCWSKNMQIMQLKEHGLAPRPLLWGLLSPGPGGLKGSVQ